jgi:predicted nucleotide-binding protein (sugar kinase/HSP70/actin superfamily)
MVTVGIPRALLYYQYYPMWKTFFEELGAEVVVSSTTTRDIVAAGSARTAAETCLPVKVYCGHVLSLAGKCDYIFIPDLRSLKKDSYNCSKFLGLPDIVRAVVPESPPILDVEIEIPKGKNALYSAIYNLGRRFSRNPFRVKKAAEAALKAHNAYYNLMRRKRQTSPEAIAEMMGEENHNHRVENGLDIALIGHPYVLYDDYINHRLIAKLRAMGANVFTPEMAPEEELSRSVARIVGKEYWTYEDDVTGAGGYYLEGNVDGVIGVIPFGCGPDSLMMDMVRRHARENGDTSFMVLSIDEHAAEAGLITRLEAFVDMTQRKKRHSRCV